MLIRQLIISGLKTQTSLNLTYRLRTRKIVKLDHVIKQNPSVGGVSEFAKREIRIDDD